MTQKILEVLVVDDEAPIREMIQFALRKAGMHARSAGDARQALVLIGDCKPDIILLDWMMPAVSGLELTRRLRKNPLTADIPIIMLTAKITENDKVAGLDAGTDDYIVKPFSPRELIARIRAVLRRSQPQDADGKITAGRITMDLLAMQVFIDEKTTHTGPTEYRLLEFLLTHPGRTYSRTQLLDNVWGANAYLEDRTVDVHIRRLRKILATAGLEHYIQTVRSHGYRFAADDQ